MTQDQFDAIDFSDNEIKKLDNFPRYKRLSSLMLCNNHVSKISEELGTALPNLTCLILTNNKVWASRVGVVIWGMKEWSGISPSNVFFHFVCGIALRFYRVFHGAEKVDTSH